MAWVVAARDRSDSPAASGRMTYTFAGVVWACCTAATSSRPLRSRGTIPTTRRTTNRLRTPRPTTIIVRVRARRGGRSLVSMLVTGIRGGRAAQQAVGQRNEDQGIEGRD